MEDEEPGQSLEPRRKEMIDLVRQVFDKRQRLDEHVSTLLNSAIPLGTLSDLIAHALGLPPATKQALLAEPRVERRVVTL